MGQIDLTIWQGAIDNDAMTCVKNIARDTSTLRNGLVCLPEMFLGRWNRHDPDNHQPQAMQALQEIAAQRQLTFLGSALDREGDASYNTIFRIDPTGVVPLYKKIHLFRAMGEHQRYQAGSQAIVIDVQGVRVGLAICYDLRFSRLFEALREEGAQLVVLPARWPVDRLHHWRTLAQARAIEFQIFLCAVNCLGSDQFGETLVTYAGNSLLVGPWGEVLVDAQSNAGVFAGRVDVESVLQARRRIDVWQDRVEIGKQTNPTGKS